MGEDAGARLCSHGIRGSKPLEFAVSLMEKAFALQPRPHVLEESSVSTETLGTGMGS